MSRRLGFSINLSGGLGNRQTCLYIVSMATTKAAKSEAKQRLLEAADRLFYQEGIRSVGIDRVIAEASVAKMTLYTHFPSKDDLILAVLQFREQQLLEFFGSAMKRHAKRRKNKLSAFFAALKDWFQSPGFRGCAFQNAAVELADPAHPASKFARDHKRRFADMLSSLVEDSLGKRATKLAPAINLLVEGAIMVAVVQGNPDAATVAWTAAERLATGEKGN